MITLIGKEDRIRKQYNRLTEEERKTYHRDYMRRLRQSKTDYYSKVLRGEISGRDIDETKLFKKQDYDYIKSIATPYMINYQALIDELLPKKEALQNELRLVNEKIRQYEKNITLYEWREKKSNK